MKPIKAAFSLSSIGPGLGELKKALHAINVGDAFVVAGVVGNKATAERGGTEDVAGITNAELAVIHEFGAPGVGIPPRPFVFGSFNKNRDEYRRMLAVAVKRGIVAGVANGIAGADEYLRMLKLIGLKMANDMKAYVVGGAPIPPPNSPAVLKRKQEKGQAELARRQRKAIKQGKDPSAVKTADVRTLVDTGRLVGSITYELRGAGKDKP